MPNEISVVFNNGSSYEYHFIIKELAKEFMGQFECFGEYSEKYKIFSVPIEKEIKKVDKDLNENIVTISYKIKFIIAQNLWQFHYQILLLTSQKEFT